MCARVLFVVEANGKPGKVGESQGCIGEALKQFSGVLQLPKRQVKAPRISRIGVPFPRTLGWDRSGTCLDRPERLLELAAEPVLVRRKQVQPYDMMGSLRRGLRW